MNISENVINFLDNKDYTDLEKIRYIYLYICKIFSYDIRFTVGNEQLKEDIYNYKVDIENVRETELVCYSICRILQDTLALYGFKSELKKDYNDIKFSHVYLELKYNDYLLKLDPTISHDLTRVKMNSNTLNFTSLNNKEIFDMEVKNADKRIKSDLKDVDLYEYYNNETVSLLNDTIEKSAIDRHLTEDEIFYEKLLYMFSLINTRKDFKSFDDVDYYLSYLIRKFKLNGNNVYNVNPGIFFKRDDKTLKNIVDIILIEYKYFPPEFHLLEKVNDSFKVRQLINGEINDILNEYQSYSCQFYFEKVANKLNYKNTL